MNFIVNGQSSDILVLFAHGAGAGMQSEFMTQVAEKLAEESLKVVRFNFGYMQANMDDGKRRPPERMPKLLTHYQSAIEQVYQEYNPKKVFLMGKSMGGRVGAILAAETQTAISGVICLGYPFVPMKGGSPRLEPIHQCPAPICIIQGERDRFGNKEQVTTWPLPESLMLSWIPDGDHSLQPRKMSGFTWEQNLQQTIQACVNFIKKEAKDA